MQVDVNKLKPLATRRQIMLNARTNTIQADAANMPLTNGQLVSPTVTIRPITSGLQLYAVLFVRAKVKNNAATTATRCEMAGANMLQHLTHYNADSLQGHQCSGQDLEIMALRRQSSAMGSTDALSDNYGIAFQMSQSDNMPTTIAAGATVDVTHSFVIPFAYGAGDFRGAIAATQSNSAQNFQCRFPTKTEAFVDVTANPYNAMYSVAGGDMEFTEFRYEMIVRAKTSDFGLEDLPYEDMSYSYRIQGFSKGGIAANTDTRIPLDPGRIIMSSYIGIDNGGVTYGGDDVNYTTIYGAATQDLHHLTPMQHKWEMALNMGLIPPKGYYVWNHTAKPINVAAWGGQVDLTVNMKTVNANCTIHGANDYFVLEPY